MRHGKNPTRSQKKFLQSMNLNVEDWLVVKDTPEAMTILHRQNNKTREIIKRKEN